jgi:hypothetical protein
MYPSPIVRRGSSFEVTRAGFEPAKSAPGMKQLKATQIPYRYKHNMCLCINSLEDESELHLLKKHPNTLICAIFHNSVTLKHGILRPVSCGFPYGEIQCKSQKLKPVS